MEYDLEFYGFTYADYLARRNGTDFKGGEGYPGVYNDGYGNFYDYDVDTIFDFLGFLRWDPDGKLPDQTLKIFYPYVKPPTTPPPPPPLRPEKPRFPLIPVWFEPCGCKPCCCVPCCKPCDPCQVDCYVPTCSPVRTTCESYLSDDSAIDSDAEAIDVLPVPTLAPPLKSANE